MGLDSAGGVQLLPVEEAGAALTGDEFGALLQLFQQIGG
jgi:hypothetical protein